jgi:hypothetical protein
MPVSKTENVVWDGWWTVGIDVFMHIIPLAFIIHKYGSYYSKYSDTLIPLVITISLICIYLVHVRNIMAYFRMKGDVFAMYSVERRYAPIIMCGRIYSFHSIQCICQDVTVLGALKGS